MVRIRSSQWPPEAFIKPLVELVVSIVTTTAARACSICRSGDPTLAALGANGFAASQWRLALDWDRVSKSTAVNGDDRREHAIWNSGLTYAFQM